MIKLNFMDFAGVTEKTKELLLPLLEKHFGGIIESDNPDFVICSSYGYTHLKYDCVKIFITQENVQPDFNLVDYGIAFSYMKFEDRYLRYPLYYAYVEDYQKALHKHEITNFDMEKKKKFCNWVCSNSCADPRRDEYFNRLCSYKKVDSGGRYLNNIGTPVANKVDFQSDYKFSLAFENSSNSGYTTEKIIQAFAAKTIPIYWGNPNIAREFNTKAFINCHDYESFDDVIAKVKEIDENEELFLQYLKEPICNSSQYRNNSLEELENYLVYIISQGPEEAKRRNNILWGEKYQSEMKYLRLEDLHMKLSTRILRKVNKMLKR